MFIDVVGYTSMSSGDEGTALGLLGRYRAVLNSVFPKYEGRVVKTMGDGFLIEFAGAGEAVNSRIYRPLLLRATEVTDVTEKRKPPTPRNPAWTAHTHFLL